MLTRPLTRAITRAITDPAVGGGASFPESLYADGTHGEYWDNLAADAFFQDSAGATPNTSSGQSCGRFVGQRGNHWEQSTSGVRPTYIVDESGLKCVRFNGTTQFMSAASLVLTGATKATLVFGIRQKRFTGTGAIIENQSPTTVTNGGMGSYINNGTPAGAIGAGLGSSSGNYVYNNAGGASTERLLVASIVYDPSGANADARARIRVDGVEYDETQPASSGTPTAAGITVAGFYLGARTGTLLFSEIDFYCGILYGDEMTAEQLAEAEAWCAVRTNTVMTESVTVENFNDTATVTDMGTHRETSAFSFTEYTTDATVIEVDSYNTIYGTFSFYAHTSVIVNGTFSQSIAAPAAGASTGRATLPGGSKTIRLVNGLTTKPASSVLGTWPVTIKANAPLTQVAATANNRILFYGDSITVGGNSAAPAGQGFVPLVRAAYSPDSVAVEGYGYRALNSDCASAPARAAFVAKVVAYAPERIWIAIGTNDYGIAPWNAANFGTAYAALLDDLHAALPSATIFCQTPIVRTSEAANGFGNTLGDYRTQISTAVSTRTSYATLVDGTAILTTGDLADGVHPSTAGHITYANYVKTVLGI